MNVTAIPRRSFQFKALIIFLLLTLGIGVVGRIAGGTAGYNDLIKPPLTPPDKVASFIWTVLYIIIGIAAYLVWNMNDIDGGRVLRLYLLQLVFSSLWMFFFMRLRWRLFSFFWILFLIALISLVLTGFKYIRKSAYLMMIPYFLWNIFLAYLNLGFYLLNR